MTIRSTIAKAVLVAIAAATLPAPGLAQVAPGGNRVINVPCCTCVDGSVKAISINTGTAGWTISGPGISGSPAPTILSHAAWAPVAPAAWVGPVGGSGTSAASGNYTYAIRFNVPSCMIGSRIVLKGRFGADNTATILLDGNPIASTPATGTQGFLASNIRSFSVPVATNGLHTLTVRVNNISGPTAVAVQASVEAQCPKEAANS